MSLQLKSLANAETLLDVAQDTQRICCYKSAFWTYFDHSVLITSCFSMNLIFHHSFRISHSRSKQNSENINKNVKVYLAHGNSQITWNTLPFFIFGEMKKLFPGAVFFFLVSWHSCTKWCCRNCHLSSLCLPFLRLLQRDDNSVCTSSLFDSSYEFFFVFLGLWNEALLCIKGTLMVWLP